ncbi:mechanosensitive ion channel family protein [Nakamurella alba]|nr:mechanosensitive ion channel domain-containing protein [Nakamurella alba]
MIPTPGTQLAAEPDGLVADAESLFRATGLPILITLAAATAGFLLAGVLARTALRLTRRWSTVAASAGAARRPLRWTLSLVGAQIGAHATTAPARWREITDRVFTLALIAGITWLLAVAVIVATELLLTRFDMSREGNRQIRRIRTQITLVRRIVVAALVVLGLGAALLTFPGARIAGAGVLTSAGLISIVAGLAAQSALANVFAGIQLAFTDAIRVDDVVVVEGRFGNIDEITLTYVVVRVWDERSLILPSTYFTTTPFENLTRQQAGMLGTVELDLDWTVPVDDVRARLREHLAGNSRWDERVGIVQVTDAVSSYVRVRILVSAADSPNLFDLRCDIREDLVLFLQQHHPAALPRLRVVPGVPPLPGTVPAQQASPVTVG